MNDMTIYARSLKNLVVVTNSEDMLRASSTISLADSHDDSFFNILTRATEESFLIAAKPETLFAGVVQNDPLLSAILSRFVFTDYSSLAFSINADDIMMKAVIPVSAEDDPLSVIVNRSSVVPPLLSLLPENTQYYTILSPGSLEELLNVITPSLSDSDKTEFERLWRNANRLSRAGLSMDINELLFSWTGKEFAAFGLEGRSDPVFAMRIADDVQRERVFSSAFSSLLIKSSNNLIINGIRIPRIQLPAFLQGVVSFFGIELPSPYYILENGYVFFSESAEALANLSASIKGGKRLVRDLFWERISRNLSPESGISLYYNLERSTPFFLRSDSSISRILGLYKTGRADIRFTDGDIIFQLQATVSAPTSGTILPGFPVKAGGKLSPELYGFTEGSTKRLFWLEDDIRVISFNPINMTSISSELDSPGWIVSADRGNNSERSKGALWGVSRNGTVWLYDKDLSPLAGFPVLTGEQAAAPPAAQGNSVIVTLENGTLCKIDDTGSVSMIQIPHTGELKAAPSVNGSALSVYSKSFFGEIFLVEGGADAGGLLPITVDEIAYGSPALLSKRNRAVSELYTGFVTQSGTFSVWDRRGNLATGFPLRLDGVFYLNARASQERFWLLSAEGILFRVGLDGSVLSVAIPGMKARDGYITLADYNGDGVDEVFVSGDGNLLYGFTDSLELIRGFPIAAWGTPVFMDINGNTFMECIAPALNNTVSAWKIE